MMSARDACTAGLIRPPPAPASTEMMIRGQKLCARPSTPVNTPAVARPARMSGRRPRASASRPENCRVTAMPAANAVSASPEAAPPCSNTDAANSGSIATRAPMLTKPLVNAVTKSAR